MSELYFAAVNDIASNDIRIGNFFVSTRTIFLKQAKLTEITETSGMGSIQTQLFPSPVCLSAIASNSATAYR